jgi:predicted permease
MPPVGWLARARAAIRLVTGFLSRRSRDAELDEEIQFHLEQATARNVHRGMTPADAGREALVALGGRAQWTEETRDEQRSRVLDDFGRDLRYGVAALRRNAGFAAGAIITIALAIAATTTVFNFVSAVYTRPLDVPEGARLVRIHGTHSATEEQELGFPAYRRLQQRTKTLDAVVAHYSTAPLYVEVRGEAHEVPSAVVSADYFRMLGLRAALGRFFAASEDSVPDRDAVAVIGYGLWQSRFGADSQVIGEHIAINGRSFTIVGVAPRGFDGIGGGLVNAMWIPTMMLRTGYRYCNGFEFSCGVTSIMARLAPGATVRDAQNELAALRAMLVAGDDTAHAVRHVVVEPATGIRDEEQRRYANLSALLWSIAIVLLVVASANLGGLLLARGMARRREFALRSSLGANRWRIVRQLLVESLLLGIAGGAVGVTLSLVTSRAMAGFFSSEVRRLAMPLDTGVLLFVACATFVTVLLFGLFPALRVSKVDVSEALKTGSNRTGNRARGMLVASQAVLAVVLLTAASLLSRSFDRAMAGGAFDPTHVAQVRLRPALVGYSVDSAQAYFHAAISKIQGIPGVVSASPIRGSLDVRSAGTGSATVALPGEVPPTGDNAPQVKYLDVGPDFFATFRIPVLSGREFSERDTPSAPLVLLVNETMARRLWGSAGAVGRFVSLDGGTHTLVGGANWKTFQVVGVVKDYRPNAFGETPLAMAYTAFWQTAFGTQRDARVAIRVQGDPLLALVPIRRALESVDRAVPVTGAGSIEQEMRTSYAEVRLGRLVLTASAALTLFLAAVGLYGVVAYLVTQRSKEIAIRLAVGARPGQVVAMFVGQGLRPIVAGSALGLIASLATAPLLARWLFGIAPTDVVSILAAVSAVTAVALIAGYLPARRAAGTDPAAVFRAE